MKLCNWSRKVLPESITSEFIYSKLDDWSIYRYYLGEFTIGNAICNKIRGDRTPSLVISMRSDGHLRHKDHGDERYSGSCIALVEQMFGLNYDKALRKIASDMGLIGSGEEYKKIIGGYTKPVINLNRHSVISVTAKKWDKKSLEYWQQYGITPEQLKKDEVYCVKEYSINRKSQHIAEGQLVFAYRYSEGFKIYIPSNPKTTRWKSSIPCTLVEGLQNMNGHPDLLIVKTKKERLTLQNIFPDMEILNVQNESTSAYTEKFLQRVKGKIVRVSYDSDDAGVKASKKVCELTGFGYINPPREYLEKGCKDWSDMIAAGLRNEVVEQFKQKGVIV